MAHPAPPTSHKAPGLASSPNNGSASSSQFTPRKEFLRESRIVSTFALLTLSGTGAVRLYSFPPTAISALRRLFDHQELITTVREHAPKNFFEFSLDRKPWANPRSYEAEKLIIGILTVILQCGFSFLSTIDYGREQDDRVAMAFSKPASIPSIPASVLNSSAITLPQPGRAPFGLSFPSATVLRVVDPPLHSTPAILQAVRGAWPRGVINEKKVGDGAWEFKLKGYKWFQEDTFAADSLHHILSLLSSLDSHAFTLLTSLSLANRSRGKDLWIFTGPSEDVMTPESPNSSPANSSLELKREMTPQHLAGASGPPIAYPAQPSNEKLAPGAPSWVGNGSVFPLVDAHQMHTRSASDTTPATSSPLKPAMPPAYKAQGGVLRKATPKVQVPLAFSGENDPYGIPLANNGSDPLSNSVGSLDMTGVGSGRGRADRQSRTPEVLYTTGAQVVGLPMSRQDGHNLWQTMGGTSQPVREAGPAPSGRHSPTKQRRPDESSTSYFREVPLDSRPPRDDQARSSTSSSRGGRSPPTTPPTQHPQYHAPSPTPAPVSNHILGNNYTPANGSDDARRDRDATWPDTPRTPTPPLLTPGVFRDSAFSSTTGRTSYEIPIAWTGRDSDPTEDKKRGTLTGILEEDEEGRKVEKARSKDRTREYASQPRGEDLSPGPALPGAWSPKVEGRRDDVVNNMHPPTIREQPSQELAETQRTLHSSEAPLGKRAREASTTSPARSPEGEGAKRKEVGSVSTSPQNTARGGPRATSNGAPQGRMSPTRRGSDSSGWVWVNIGDGAGGKGKEREMVASNHMRGRTSPTSGIPTSSVRPAGHTRSSSDSRLHRSPVPTNPETGAALASMSAAAKAIVMIDAVDAKGREHEKSQSGSGFRRIFAKSKDKGSSNSNDVEKRKTPERQSSEAEEPRSTLKEKWTRRATPASKRSDKRRSLD